MSAKEFLILNGIGSVFHQRQDGQLVETCELLEEYASQEAQAEKKRMLEWIDDRREFLRSRPMGGFERGMYMGLEQFEWDFLEDERE